MVAGSATGDLQSPLERENVILSEAKNLGDT